MQLNWDIFCRVIDNHGDIGVCWRLARQLADEHGKAVRLWVDDLNSLKSLYPAVDPGQHAQLCAGVEIRCWDDAFAFGRPSDVVVEAFACELPAAYLEAMATMAPQPCWINLEYLSAESWIDGCHGMASPHPSLPLVKYFYFPGFSSASGGLLRESDLLAKRNAEIARLKHDGTLDISLFCYDTAPVGELLAVLSAEASPVRLHVAPGKPLSAVSGHLGGGGPWQVGAMRVLPFDFLPQEAFDQLLWGCDVNFVRGEDSFVRALWAGKPFVWQAYLQEEEAHLKKLAAFLDRYTPGLSPAGTAAAVNLFRAWNSRGDLHAAWPEFIAARMELAHHNLRWAAHLAESMDLSTGLVKFCSAKV